MPVNDEAIQLYAPMFFVGTGIPGMTAKCRHCGVYVPNDSNPDIWFGDGTPPTILFFNPKGPRSTYPVSPMPYSVVWEFFLGGEIYTTRFLNITTRFINYEGCMIVPGDTTLNDEEDVGEHPEYVYGTKFVPEFTVVDSYWARGVRICSSVADHDGFMGDYLIIVDESVPLNEEYHPYIEYDYKHRMYAITDTFDVGPPFRSITCIHVNETGRVIRRIIS